MHRNILPTDHLLTQLSLTNDPLAVPDHFINFEQVPLPIYIQRDLKTAAAAYQTHASSEQLLARSSLNESRIKLAMEMAKLDVERMKVAEPVTITFPGSAPIQPLFNIANIPEVSPRDSMSKRASANRMDKKSKAQAKQPTPRVQEDRHDVSAVDRVEVSVYEIIRCRRDILECVRALAKKAGRPKLQGDPAEEKKHASRVHQQVVRSARTLYSLQQQIRQVQKDVDRYLSSSNEKSSAVVHHKLLNAHRGVLKAANEIALLCLGGVEKQFCRSFSELSHLIRQLTLICDQLSLESIDCCPKILDELSQGEIPLLDSENKNLRIDLAPVNITEEEVIERGESPPATPERERTIRAGILALGQNQQLAAKYNMAPKQKRPPSKPVIYSTNRGRPMVRNYGKSHVTQSTVASQLKSVNNDMIIRSSAVSVPNSKLAQSGKTRKPKSSSPIYHRSPESFALAPIDESTILSSSRQHSASPPRETRQKRSPGPHVQIADPEKVSEELENYVEATKKTVKHMRQERYATQKLFDQKKGLTLEAYNDIRSIAQIKLIKFANHDEDSKVILNRLNDMSDIKFRYLVKECSLNFSTFDFEDIAESLLEFLVEEYMESKYRSRKDRMVSMKHRSDLEALEGLLLEVEKVERIGSEISQRNRYYGVDADRPVVLGSSKEVKVPKSVHFREPEKSTSSWASSDGMIVVSKDKSKVIAGEAIEAEERSEYDLIRTPLPVHPDVVRTVEANTKQLERHLENTLRVDMSQVNPGRLLDEISKEIMEELMEDVLNDVNNVCDGFAEAVFTEEFAPVNK